MDNNLCQICKIKPAQYDLLSLTDIKCTYCKEIKYVKSSMRLRICDFECGNLCLLLGPMIDSRNIKVIYSLDKDTCKKCGRKDFPEALFEGINLGKIKSKL